MKKNFLCILFALFILKGCNSVVLAQTITVSGAGSDVNGNYDHMGWETNGKDGYSRTSGDVRLIFWNEDNVWVICDGGVNVFYKNTANTLYPPTGGWQVDVHGVVAVPILTGNVDPLPVELVTFTSSAKNNDVELKWSTATEINNYGFEIEKCGMVEGRSKMGDGRSEMWQKIGFVEGNGTTNVSKEYSFVEINILAGKYSYRLKQIDRDGKFSYSNVVEASVAEVKQFGLEQNFPNPFNPTTMINYQLPVNSLVSLKVYDAIGREVITMVNGIKEAGTYSAKFDGSKLSCGIYFYTLRAGNFVSTKKITLTK